MGKRKKKKNRFYSGYQFDYGGVDNEGIKKIAMEMFGGLYYDTTLNADKDECSVEQQ